MSRHRTPGGLADDAKEAVDSLFDRYTELTAEVESLEQQIQALTAERDMYRSMLDVADAEIERLKGMAFEEVVREVATERLGGEANESNG